MANRAATIDEVFNAIRSEREYQDKLWGPTESRGDHTVGEFILYMEDYLAEARTQVSRNAGRAAAVDALHTIRKIAALATVCMEQNGAPLRLVEHALATKGARHKYL